jgi:hypothetical protein
MDDGSLIKDYSEKEKETEQGIQMAVRQVAFEDERFLVSSSRQIPIGSNTDIDIRPNRSKTRHPCQLNSLEGPRCSLWVTTLTVPRPK